MLIMMNYHDITKFLEVKNLKIQEVIDYINNEIRTWSYYIFAICDIENSKHIGNLKIGLIDYKNKTSDLLILIGNKFYLSRGIASEAIKIGNEIAFGLYDI